MSNKPLISRNHSTLEPLSMSAWIGYTLQTANFRLSNMGLARLDAFSLFGTITDITQGHVQELVEGAIMEELEADRVGGV